MSFPDLVMVLLSKVNNQRLLYKIFLKHWISIFGTPVSVLSDNGGEFASKDFIDFCENFNIKKNNSSRITLEQWHL